MKSMTTSSSVVRYQLPALGFPCWMMSSNFFGIQFVWSNHSSLQLSTMQFVSSTSWHVYTSSTAQLQGQILAVEASQSSPSPWYNRSNGFQWQRRLCLKMRCPKIPMIHDQNRHHLGHPTRPLDPFGPCEGHQRPHGVGVAQSCGAASGLFAVHFQVFPVTLTVNQLPRSEFRERIPCFMKRSGCAFQRTVSKHMETSSWLIRARWAILQSCLSTSWPGEFWGFWIINSAMCDVLEVWHLGLSGNCLEIWDLAQICSSSRLAPKSSKISCCEIKSQAAGEQRGESSQGSCSGSLSTKIWGNLL